MKCNKKLLAVAAAGALTVATAVPALALENEFHGSFTSYYDLSNYTGTGNDTFEATKNATGLHHNAKTENYFVQRARIGYTAKVSDQVKLNTKFELDYTYLGNSSYTTGRNQGGGLGADTVNIETKNVFLELNYPALNTKIGMMPYNDSFKGILFDADMAGILFAHDYSNASVAAGFFRFSDQSPALDPNDSGGKLGRKTNDMISADAKYSISKDLKVGAAYYYITDNRGATDLTVHTLGLNAEGTFGPLTLNGFAVKQAGDARGWAFNMGAKAAVMGGTLRSEAIYVSGAGSAGGGNRFFVPTSPAGSEGAALYDSELIILHRDKNAKTIDTALIYDVNNFDQGMIMGSIGYDHACTDKITSSVNAGFAAVARDNGATQSPRRNSNYVGTEINLESNYKLTPNVTLGVRTGYVFLGDYYRGLNADNPYDFKVLANLAF
jgi:hypothetical protein